MLRTVIEGTADGSLLITRESRVGVSGSARERRKQQRQGVEEKWRAVDRVITRSLERVPAKAASWGVLEYQRTDRDLITAQDHINKATTQMYIERAASTVAEIELLNKQHTVTVAPRRMRIVWDEPPTTCHSCPETEMLTVVGYKKYACPVHLHRGENV